MNEKPSYNTHIYISYINVLSAVAVVILHANGAFWDYRSDRSWAINNIVESVFYFAVPCFFMVVGAIQIDYRERYSTSEYLKRRFKKTFIPFVVWCFVYKIAVILFDIIANHNSPNLSINPIYIFNGIFNTEWMDVFWFFIPLFCIYLSMPFLSLIKKDNTLKAYEYIASVAFLINIFVPFIISIINYYCDAKLKWGFNIGVMSEYLFYVAAGYIIHHYDFNKKHRLIIYAFALCGLLAHIIGTYTVSRAEGTLSELYKGYNNLPCVLYSVGIFVFVKNLCVRITNNNKINIMVVRISKYTFAIYLMHILAIWLVKIILDYFGITETSQLYVLLLTVTTIPICILATNIMRRIPVIKNIVP